MKKLCVPKNVYRIINLAIIIFKNIFYKNLLRIASIIAQYFIHKKQLYQKLKYIVIYRQMVLNVKFLGRPARTLKQFKRQSKSLRDFVKDLILIEYMSYRRSQGLTGTQSAANIIVFLQRTFLQKKSMDLKISHQIFCTNISIVELYFYLNFK